MLMIGVMPLPALMKRSFSGAGSGSVNDALDVGELDDRRPGRHCLTEYGETAPSSTSLGVIEIMPSSRSGSLGQRVRAPVVHAVDDDRRCARTGPARAPATPSPA